MEKLLLVLGEEAFSTSELMEKLGLSHRPTFRKNYLLPAMKQGLVEMTIPDKPNSRNQKYRKNNLVAHRPRKATKIPTKYCCYPIEQTTLSCVVLRYGEVYESLYHFRVAED